VSRLGWNSSDRTTQTKALYNYFSVPNYRVSQVNPGNQTPGGIELNHASQIGGKEFLFSFSKLTYLKLSA
jgi:hypothetical protein